MRTHAHARARTRTHARTHPHTNAYVRTYVSTRTRTRAHTHAHSPRTYVHESKNFCRQPSCSDGWSKPASLRIAYRCTDSRYVRTLPFGLPISIKELEGREGNKNLTYVLNTIEYNTSIRTYVWERRAYSEDPLVVLRPSIRQSDKHIGGKKP